MTLYSVDLTYERDRDNPVEFHWHTRLDAEDAVEALSEALKRHARLAIVDRVVYFEVKRSIRNVIGLEAVCERCGEHCNPAGETEGDLEHGERLDGTPCGGLLTVIGEWGT